MTTELASIETALVTGDLSRLTSGERVTYYMETCKSLKLNPLTKPFAYVTLNGTMTLYALKGATDQLRRVNGVSITKVDIQTTDTHVVVTVTGSDISGRTDVEIGMVAKSDMRGDLANVTMKAITKAKRRLTLALCGLGMLDETEVETVPGSRVGVVDVTTGEIAAPAAKALVAPVAQVAPAATQAMTAAEESVDDLKRLVSRARAVYARATAEGASTAALLAAATAANKALSDNAAHEKIVSAMAALTVCIDTLERVDAKTETVQTDGVSEVEY